MRVRTHKLTSFVGSVLVLATMLGASGSADGFSVQDSTTSAFGSSELAALDSDALKVERIVVTAGADADSGDELADAPGALLWERIPARPEDARTGSKFMDDIKMLNLYDREDAVIAELLAGNIPNFLRAAVTIETTYRGHHAVLAVMPDYLAVGTDEDFVRVPMNPKTAQALADAFGGMVPTKKVVDEVHRQASVKLSPQNMTTAIDRTTTFIVHNQRIEHQRRGMALGALTAGHKKDIINSRRVHNYPDRVCIYGWHNVYGAPIQPLSTIHEFHHVDYSHGLRLMSNRVLVDGIVHDVSEVLSDRELAGLLSHEGTLDARLPQIDS